MHVVLEVTDLLQLHEIWSLRPIVSAFSRLERRQPSLSPGQIRFDMAELVPRLSRLRHSPEWQQDKPADDPARLAIRDLSEAHLSQLYPEIEVSIVRQTLFEAAYHSFVVARYQGDVQPTREMLRALAHSRQVDADIYLDQDGQPRQGSPDWIPADITDEIRRLDPRYQPAVSGTPAAYVIADPFWSLLVKANTHEIEAAARRCAAAATQQKQRHQALTSLAALAQVWNRSPSVVGLCYQMNPEDQVL